MAGWSSWWDFVAWRGVWFEQKQEGALLVSP
jgi:hypothetical protein